MLLFFDTETTGIVDGLPPVDDPSQPHLVQLAALLTDDDGAELSSLNCLIKPDGWKVPDEAAAIHGFDTDTCKRVGVTAQSALALFAQLTLRSSRLIAFNLDFDERVLMAAFARVRDRKKWDWFHWKTGKADRFCAMKAATPACKIRHEKPRNPDDPWKWPKLGEPHKILLGEEMTNAHDAMADVRATKAVYFELLARERDTEAAGDAA